MFYFVICLVVAQIQMCKNPSSCIFIISALEYMLYSSAKQTDKNNHTPCFPKKTIIELK